MGRVKVELMHRWSAEIIALTDTMILLKDLDEIENATVTNSADEVIAYLIETNLIRPNVFYKDTMNRLDKLDHDGKKFITFVAGTSEQQQFLRQFCDKPTELPSGIGRRHPSNQSSWLTLENR